MVDSLARAAHLVDRQSVARQLVTLHGQRDLSRSFAHLQPNVRGARSGGQHATNLLGIKLVLFDVGAHHLDPEIGFDPALGLIEPHGQRLREGNAEAGYHGERGIERGDEPLVRVRGGPLFARVQDHVHVAFVESHRFGGKVRPPFLSHDGLYLGEAAHDPLGLAREMGGVPQRNARRAESVDEDRSFIESRHELGSDSHEPEQRDPECERRAAHDERGVLERPGERVRVASAQRLHPPVWLLVRVPQEER